MISETCGIFHRINGYAIPPENDFPSNPIQNDWKVFLYALKNNVLMKKVFLVFAIVALSLALPVLSNIPLVQGTGLLSSGSTAMASGPENLSGSLLILLALGIGFTARKIHEIRSLSKEEM